VLKHGQQDDSISCGIAGPNTLEANLFGDVELFRPSRRYAMRMRYFLLIMKAQLAEVSSVSLWPGLNVNLAGCRAQALPRTRNESGRLSCSRYQRHT
jgi:hypothetical protein